MDKLKEAFQKVRRDINDLKEEIILLKKSLETLNLEISTFKLNLEKATFLPTNQQKIPAHSGGIPTDKYPNTGLKPDNLSISIGNKGVPTDRQTDRQTDQHIPQEESINTSLGNALEILKSLDSLKKEIRLKFKRLTSQEFFVFSAIYQLEEESGFSDYKTLSQRLSISESSIREYVGKLIKKGIPIEKIKVNNKIIHLVISKNLKKIAPLSIILQLRDL